MLQVGRDPDARIGRDVHDSVQNPHLSCDRSLGRGTVSSPLGSVPPDSGEREPDEAYHRHVLTVPRAFGYPRASRQAMPPTDDSAGCGGQKGSLAPAIGRQDSNQSSFSQSCGVGRPLASPGFNLSGRSAPAPPRLARPEWTSAVPLSGMIKTGMTTTETEAIEYTECN